MLLAIQEAVVGACGRLCGFGLWRRRARLIAVHAGRLGGTDRKSVRAHRL
jgi:hypothetical protein